MEDCIWQQIIHLLSKDSFMYSLVHLDLYQLDTVTIGTGIVD